MVRLSNKTKVMTNVEDRDDSSYDSSDSEDDRRNKKNNKNDNKRKNNADDESVYSDAGGAGSKAGGMNKGLMIAIAAIVGIATLAAVGVSSATLIQTLNAKTSTQAIQIIEATTTPGNTTLSPILCGGILCVSNAQCINQACICLNGFYNNSKGLCVPFGTYQSTCTNTSECETNSRLICATAATRCNCPTTSQPNYCDCPSGFYWDYSTNKCETVKQYGHACSNGLHYQCTPNLGLSCNGACNCGATSYWNGASCVAKMALNSNCNASRQCQDYANPAHSCVANKCSCPTQHYISGSSCLPEKTYQDSCTAGSTECSPSKKLYCPSVANVCNCPVSSTARKCDCIAGNYWNGKTCVSRNAYGKSCSGGNYECISGLICNNTICSCPLQYYWDGSKCVAQKTYMAACLSDNQCNTTSGLVCPKVPNTCNCPTTSAAFKCDCPSTYYWHSTIRTCVPRKSYGVACSTNAHYQCAFGSSMICISGKCGCTSAQFWNGSHCVAKKTYLTPCGSNAECLSTKGLVCPTINNTCNCPNSATAFKCDCPPGKFWNSATQTCVTQNGYGVACLSGAHYQCIAGKDLLCTGTCTCPSTHFWSGSQCLVKKNYNEACSSNSYCNSTRGLVCPTTNGTCTCPISATAFKCDCPKSTYWSTANQKCITRVSYGSACTNGVDYECISGFGLTCTGTCNCSGTDYWNGTSCVSTKSYLSSCSSSSQCDQVKGLVCPTAQATCSCPTTNTAFKCDCPPTSYWNSALNACITRAQYGQSCTSGQNYQCTFGKNMICNGICTCPSTRYWDGTQCAAKKTYQVTCASNNECNNTANLICPLKSTDCNCPSTSVAFKCDCNQTHYWDGKTCVPRLNYLATCSGPNYKCISGRGLICNGTCRCNYTQYYDGTKCVDKKFSGSCVNNTMCQDYLNPAVTCISRQCSCPTTTHYPSNGACLTKKTYQATCSVNAECKNNLGLVCPVVTTNCNCPLTSVAYKCDCSSTGFYWDGSKCVARKAYYSTCNSGAHYQCQYGKGLICSGTCKCNSQQYWSIASNACVNKKFSGACVNTTECQDYLSPAVTCISRQCSCPSTHYPSNGACLLKKTYQVSCASAAECSSAVGLTCPSTSTNCNCPTTSVAKKCDCTSSASYWNGASCVSRIAYGGTCSPIRADYKCQAGKNMICNSICTCNTTTHFWNAAAVRCDLKKTYMVACASTTECDNVIGGLQCPSASTGCNCPTTSVARKCDCSLSQFWNSATKKCETRKTYGQTCTNGKHYECRANVGLSCNGKCVCSITSYYWNGAKCASKIYLLFYATTTGYATKTITTYGSTTFSRTTDVRIQEKPSYRIFIVDYGRYLVAQYNQSRVYQRYATTAYSYPRFADVVPNGDLYISRYRSASNHMMRHNSATLARVSNLAVGSTSYIYYQWQFRYWSVTSRFYEVDNTRRYINPITTSFSASSTERIYCNFGGSVYNPTSIGFYVTSTGLKTLYIGTTVNRVGIFNQATRAYIRQFTSVCASGYMYDILIDQNSGYMLFSCYSESRIRLWTTSTTGATNSNTGKFLSISTPLGMSYDSWGRLAVASYNSKVIIYNPKDYPFP